VFTNNWFGTVLKTGGYKVSALDIEREILALPQVLEAIVVGVDDPKFGQRVAAAIVLKDVSLTHDRYDAHESHPLILGA